MPAQDRSNSIKCFKIEKTQKDINERIVCYPNKKKLF